MLLNSEMSPRRTGSGGQLPDQEAREVPPMDINAVSDAASGPEVQGDQAPPAPLPQPAEDRILRQLEQLTRTVESLTQAFRVAQQARPLALPPVWLVSQMIPPAQVQHQGIKRVLNTERAGGKQKKKAKLFQDKGAGSSDPQFEELEQTTQSVTSGRGKGPQRRDRSREVSITSTPGTSSGSARPGRQHFSYPICLNCQRRHRGPCRVGTGVCYRCGLPGHIAKQCSKLEGKQVVLVITHPPVQPNRTDPRDRGSGQNPMQIQTEEHARNSPPAGQDQTQVMVATPQETQALDTAGTGTLLIQIIPAYVLLGTHVAYLFISHLLHID